MVDLSSAAHAVQSKALEPSQWLEDFRLEPFSVNFDALGVEMLVDFTEAGSLSARSSDQYPSG